MSLNKTVKRTPAQCHLRSECNAISNQQYFERMLSKDWDHLVIKRDPRSGEYKMSTVERHHERVK